MTRAVTWLGGQCAFSAYRFVAFFPLRDSPVAERSTEPESHDGEDPVGADGRWETLGPFRDYLAVMSVR